MRIGDEDRERLARARALYRWALSELPAGTAYNHMRALTRSFVASIDDSIGTDPAEGPAGLTGPCLGLHGEGCRCEPVAEAYAGREEFLSAIRRANTVPAADDDSEMPFGLPALTEAASHPKAGDVDERSTAHNTEHPAHGRGEC